MFNIALERKSHRHVFALPYSSGYKQTSTVDFVICSSRMQKKKKELKLTPARVSVYQLQKTKITGRKAGPNSLKQDVQERLKKKIEQVLRNQWLLFICHWVYEDGAGLTSRTGGNQSKIALASGRVTLDNLIREFVFLRLHQEKQTRELHWRVEELSTKKYIKGSLLFN